MLAPRLLAVLASAALWTASGPVAGGESDAQRLHRKGVHCMEEIERADCAVEHFEALLDERTEERELITDALLRLIKLYEKAGDDEAVKAVMRRFWEAGRGKLRKANLPYTARFLPRDQDVVAVAVMSRLMEAPLTKKLPPEMVEYVTTCDEDRRKELEEHWNWKKAQVRAREQNITTAAALAELGAEAKKRREARKKRAAEGKGRRPPGQPVFNDGLCQTVRTFGEASASAWTRMLFAFHHGDMTRSVIVAEVPGLAERLTAAAQAGRVQAAGPRTWTLVGVTFAGGAVQLASFEQDELVVAPAKMMPEIAANHAKGKRTLAKDVDKLVAGIPIDAGFFAVLTEKAVRDLGFGGMSKGKRRFFEALLPHPEGVQVAMVLHEYFGLFIRVPTDTPVKAGALIGIARKVLENQAEEDPEDAEFMRLLDLAQATDKKALLLSYVLSRGQIEQMVLK